MEMILKAKQAAEYAVILRDAFIAGDRGDWADRLMLGVMEKGCHIVRVDGKNILRLGLPHAVEA